jgi:hypothetical protein
MSETAAIKVGDRVAYLGDEGSVVAVHGRWWAWVDIDDGRPYSLNLSDLALIPPEPVPVSTYKLEVVDQ